MSNVFPAFERAVGYIVSLHHILIICMLIAPFQAAVVILPLKRNCAKRRFIY